MEKNRTLKRIILGLVATPLFAGAAIGVAGLYQNCQRTTARAKQAIQENDYFAAQRILEQVEAETEMGSLVLPISKSLEDELGSFVREGKLKQESENYWKERGPNGREPTPEEFKEMKEYVERVNKEIETLKNQDSRSPHPKQHSPQYSPQSDNPGLPLDLDLMKLCYSSQESSNRVSAKNRFSGAAGIYQYMPSTFIGLVKEAREKGIDVPYKGPLTKKAVSQALRTNRALNEWAINYDLPKRAEKFHNNPELIFASHYVNPDSLIQTIKIAYPGKTDYKDITLRELAQKRAQAGNSWLTMPQANGHPSVLEYTEALTNNYHQMLSMKYQLEKPIKNL